MNTRPSLPWLAHSTKPSAAPTVDAPTNANAPLLDNTQSASGSDRRDFVKLLGMGGLVVAASTLGVHRLDAMNGAISPSAEPWEPHAYIRIGEDGIVTIVCHRSEMGQGIRTTMPMIIADEMEADWAQCRVEQALGDDKKYGSQNTDGSTSIRDFLSKYREAGATARALLEDAAAKEWGVSSNEVKALNGQVIHTASGRTKSFGALVGTA